MPLLSFFSALYSDYYPRDHRCPQRVPTLRVLEPYKERRYMLEKHNGAMYICEQALFNTRGFVTAPRIYCTPAIELISKNPQYIPYECTAWYNGHDLIIYECMDGTISGYNGIKGRHNQPDDDDVVIGRTSSSYLVWKER